MDGSLEESVTKAISKIQPVRSAFFRRSQLIQDGVVIDDGPTLEEIKEQEKATKETEEQISEEDGDDGNSHSEVEQIVEDPDASLEGAEEETSEDIDYNSMTVAQLKQLLKDAGKPVSGKKADLISRLTE